MRILRVIPTLNPAYGGPLEGLKQSSQALSTRGHTTEVACLDSSASPWLSNFDIPCHALGPAINSYGYSARFTPWLKSNHAFYDAVIVHGIWHYASAGTWRALKNTSTPYFLFTHGMLDPWFKKQYPLKHLKKALYWQLAEHRVLRDAAAVLFTCEEERRLAGLSFKPYIAREITVSYGTRDPIGDHQAQIRDFMLHYPNLQGKRIILFLGRIHEKKGCDLLLEAFSTQCVTDQALHLVMAGPDQTGWKSQLMHRAEQLGISDRVTWTGLLQGELKWGALRAAEIFALPSHQENFGIAVAEALAAGCPVLISDKVNIWREIISDGAGLVGTDNLLGTTDMLARWLLMRPESRLLMSLKARECFLRRFEMSAVADSLLAAISMSSDAAQEV